MLCAVIFSDISFFNVIFVIFIGFFYFCIFGFTCVLICPAVCSTFDLHDYDCLKCFTNKIRLGETFAQKAQM